MVIKFNFLLALMSFTLHINAQQSREEAIEYWSNQILQKTSFENSSLSIVQQLENIIEHPIDINTCKTSDLMRIPFIDNHLATILLNYRDSVGLFHSVYQIQQISNIPSDVKQSLIHFVSCNQQSKNENNINFKSALSFQYPIQLKEGYFSKDSMSNFIGIPGQYRIKIKLRIKNHQMICLLEKDEGEKLIPDFYSLTYQSQLFKNNVRLIVGASQFQQGLGLCYGAGFTARKNGFFNNHFQTSGLESEYQSFRESKALQGVMIKYLLIPKLEFHFYSGYSFADAVNSSDSFGIKSSTSIVTSGLHRNLNELKIKNNFTCLSQFIQLKYNFKNSFISLLLANQNYNPSLNLSFLADEKLNSQKLFSIHFSSQIYRILWDFESATNQLFKNACIGRAIGMLDLNNNLSVIYRNYSPGFYSQYSNVFSEFGDGQNENGIYLTWQNKSNKNTETNTYLDVYQSPAIRYPNMINLKAWDIGFSHKFIYAKEQTGIRIQIKNVTYWQNQAEFTTQNLSGQLMRTFSIDQKQLYFRLAHKTNTNHSSLLLEAGLKIKKNKSNYLVDLASFDIPDPQIPIYLLDQVSGAYIQPVILYYSGHKASLQIQSTVSSVFRLIIQIQSIYYSNIKSIGSGVDKINSPYQIQFRFYLQQL